MRVHICTLYVEQCQLPFIYDHENTIERKLAVLKLNIIERLKKKKKNSEDTYNWKMHN